MKILLLCPFIDSQHAISRRLRASGNALLFPSNVEEAIKMIQLHGVSLDLAIIHREGLADGFQTVPNGDAPEEGIQLVAQIKGRRETTELPLIITSTRWSDADFVRHQQTPQGANAYLHWPFTENELVQMIEDMFGSPIRFARGSQTQPSITVPTESRTERTTTKLLGRETGGSPAKPAKKDKGTGATAPASVFDDVSALLEADDRTRTLAPPMPGDITIEPPHFDSVTTSSVEEGEGATRVSMISVVAPAAPGTTDVLGQFGTSMLEAAKPKAADESAPDNQPHGGLIELDPPSIRGGAGLMRSVRPDSEPETLDLSDLESLEPYERLLLKNPPAHGADGTINLSSSPEEETTNLLTVEPAKTRGTDAVTQELPTRFASTVDSALARQEPATIALGTASLAQGSGESPAVGPGRGGTSWSLELPQALDMPPVSALPEDAEPVVDLGTVEAPEKSSGPSFGGLQGAIPSRSGNASRNPDPAEEQELAQEMPYLFGKGREAAAGADAAAASAVADARLFFSEPIGDAVIPGGAAQSPDSETLKKYLLLREQDVAVLSNQLGSTRDQVTALERQVREERARNLELSHRSDERKHKLDDAARDKNLALAALQAELDDLRFQAKAKADRARLLEARVRESEEEIERMKERVRTDIRKIRVRERDLENRLEIMRKDSEALISAREQKITELKRKVDMLEFSMDLLQDKYTREKEATARLRERLARAAQVVRVAGGLLDAKGSPTPAAAGEGAGDSGSGAGGKGDAGGKQEAS